MRAALAAAGAADLAPRVVAELSDGERQRVMLARALAQDTPLLVLDEITAFLDLPRRVEVMRILRVLAHRDRRTILLSTHDLDLALRTADRIWLLPKGAPGAPATLHDGAPEDLVLGGASDAASRSEGVQFDRATETFRLHETHGATVGLDAAGTSPVVAFWTAHALERAGFTVVADGGNGAATRVAPLTSDQGARWRLGGGGDEVTCDSLAGGVQTLIGGAKSQRSATAQVTSPSR